MFTNIHYLCLCQREQLMLVTSVNKVMKMQSKEKVIESANTFQEIWAELTIEQREDLTLRLYNAGCCRTRQTIWKWSTGKACPSAPIVRDTIAAIVSKVTNTKVTSTFLFPRNK